MEGELLQPLDINNEAATEIAVIKAVLHESPDTPLARWFEYRAYQELVHLLRSADELPTGYAVLTPDAISLRDWLLRGTGLNRRFSTEITRLITRLQQSAGGGIIDNICRLYCALVGRTGRAMIGGVHLLLHVPQIAAAIAAAGGPFLIGSLWVGTNLLGYLLSIGILDDVCDCAAEPPGARRPAR